MQFDNFEDQSQNYDEFGFQKKIKYDETLLKEQFYDFPKNFQEKIVIAKGCHQYAILYTESKKLYKFTYENSQLRELELPKVQMENKGLFGNIQNFLLIAGEEKKVELEIKNIFISQNGQHALICGKFFTIYYHQKSDKLRNLNNFKNFTITSVAWDYQNQEDTTNQILIGTKDGKIYTVIIDDKQCEPKQQISLDEQYPIQNIFWVILKQEIGNLCVVIATNKTTIYIMKGSTDFNSLFLKFFSDPKAMIKKVCHPNKKSHMSISYCNQYPYAFIWTNGNQLQYYKFPQKDIDDMIQNQQLLKFSSNNEDPKIKLTEQPLNIGLTEYHYFVLQSNSLVVMSTITEKQIQIVDISKRNAINMHFDPIAQKAHIISQKGVIYLNLENDGQNVWRLYIEQKMIKEAFDSCIKQQNKYQNYVGGLYADSLLQKKECYEAAKIYSQCDRNFEETCLKFMMNDQSEGFEGKFKYQKEYLIFKLEKVINNQKIQPNEENKDTCKISVIVTVLLEQKLHNLNRFQNDTQMNDKNEDNKKKKLQLKEDEFFQFIEKYIKYIDQNIAYYLIQSHGRFENFIKYMKKKRDFQSIIANYINDERYQDALNSMNLLLQDNIIKEDEKIKIIQNVIKYHSHLFFKNIPIQFIQFLIQLLNINLDYLGTVNDQKNKNSEYGYLIRGLIDIPKDKYYLAISFLNQCVKTSKDKSLHNTLLFFMSEQKCDGKENHEQNSHLYSILDHYEQKIQNQEEIEFDLDFALRLFKRKNIVKAQITIIGLMGYYEEAVDLAIQNGYFDIAKNYADKPQDEQQKRLWLKIVKHMFQNNYSIQEIIKLTRETTVLKIDDILPHFNENTQIEYFKDEICASLEDYHEQIENLKQEMKGYSDNTELLKNQLRSLKNNCIVVPHNQLCEECLNSVFSEEFYVFPCLHSFHKNCLLKKINDETKRKKIEETDKKIQAYLEKKISKKNEQNGFFFNLLGKNPTQSTQQFSEEDQKILKQLKEIYDQLIAEECIYCGYSIVQSIMEPFNEADRNSWNLD